MKARYARCRYCAAKVRVVIRAGIDGLVKHAPGWGRTERAVPDCDGSGTSAFDLIEARP